MDNGGLQIIKNHDFVIHKEGGIKYTGKKTYFMRFGVFILIILSLFAGIFFVKDKFQSIESTKDNLNLQRQKLIEERLAVENAFKSESDKLSRLQLEYENKNKELTDMLDSLKTKEETLNSELLKVEELKGLLVKQLVDIYDLNISREYSSDENQIDSSLNSGSSDDNGIVSSTQSGIVGGISDSENVQGEVERILSIANADWFIKLDSLGEFDY